MPQFSRFNALQQDFDVAGSPTQSATRALTDETSGFGAPLSGQTGAAATIGAIVAGVVTLTGLTGMTANSVGNFLTTSGAATGANNGTFLIVEYVSATSVKISNSAGVTPDANSGAISWTERAAYTLLDDLDFERTDRQAIKGVAYDAAIPTYTRPTATGTPVPKNLNNLISLDSKLLNTNRSYYNHAVASTNTLITLTSAGNFKHASATDLTGVPCFDAAPYVGDYGSCYVFITNTADGAELTVQAGGHAGERIFGVTQNGSSTSPNSVEVKFYSCPVGGDPSTTATAYTWEATQPIAINLTYGFGEVVSALDVNALRATQSLGIVSDADLRQDINDLQATGGWADGTTNLSTYVTNTSANYVFFTLPGGVGDTVVAALNVLNAEIGDRTYTGGILSSGQTVAASLQALSGAITTSAVQRYVERLAADVNANTSHLLPGGATYTLDGTNNGRHLWVFWRGLLRDPGTVVNGDDYAETDTTHITAYSKLKSGDHVNYFVH